MQVLFIGNSFTARNDLPGLLARMAASGGRDLRHALISAGGASLRMHWNKGAALEAIRRTRYDWVVLQEQSTLPLKNAGRFHENVRLFIDPIRESGATPALYLTWARRNAPDSQQSLNDAYTTIARETGAVLVPVGMAWERFQRSHPSPPLHDKDLSHPSPAGTYLAALVFYEVLFGASGVAIGCNVPGVDAATAERMQVVARETVRAASTARR